MAVIKYENAGSGFAVLTLYERGQSSSGVTLEQAAALVQRENRGRWTEDSGRCPCHRVMDKQPSNHRNQGNAV